MSLKWESPPSLKKCPGKTGCTPFAESLPLYIDCKRSTNYVFDCLLSFIPLKSVSGRTAQGKWLIVSADAKAVVQISRGLHCVIGQGSSTPQYLE